MRDGHASQGSSMGWHLLVLAPFRRGPQRSGVDPPRSSSRACLTAFIANSVPRMFVFSEGGGGGRVGPWPTPPPTTRPHQRTFCRGTQRTLLNRARNRGRLEVRSVCFGPRRLLLSTGPGPSLFTSSRTTTSGARAPAADAPPRCPATARQTIPDDPCTATRTGG